MTAKKFDIWSVDITFRDQSKRKLGSLRGDTHFSLLAIHLMTKHHYPESTDVLCAQVQTVKAILVDGHEFRSRGSEIFKRK